ncbi:MAG TPA: hypothetical protein VIV60_09970, partial [Polyangiaceae bacterium]
MTQKQTTTAHQPHRLDQHKLTSKDTRRQQQSCDYQAVSTGPPLAATQIACNEATAPNGAGPISLDTTQPPELPRDTNRQEGWT